MYTCKNSVYTNSINKKTTIPSSSMYLSHRKKIYTPHNLLCQTPKQQGVALKHNSYDRRLTRIKALHLFPNHCAPSTASTYSYQVTYNSPYHYIINGMPDPTLTISLGDTLILINDGGAHPLYIKTALSNGTTNQITDVTVSGQGSNDGPIVFIPTSIGTYYYQCSVHEDMNGIINVIA